MKFTIIMRLLFLLSLGISSIHTEPPATHIKELHEITSTNHPHLSIINGFTWWNKGIIENMYRLGDQKSAIINLLWNLFHLQRDDVTFDITTIEKNPAKYFVPQTIGKILAVVEPYSHIKKLSHDTKQKLFDELSSTIANDIDFDKLIKKSEIKVEKIKSEAKKESFAYKSYLEIIEILDAISKKKSHFLKQALSQKKQNFTIALQY